MKDISIYFQPIASTEVSSQTIGASILRHDDKGFPDISSKGVAIFYVPEFRNATIQENQDSTDFSRGEFYKLFPGDNWDFPIYDLGTILPGETFDDTCFAVSQVIAELVKNGVVPYIVGGSHDLIMACYKGFESLEQMINICTVDYSLDIGEPSVDISSTGFVSHLLMQRPCYLFNYSSIGIQRPFVSSQELDLFDKLFFDVCRLGELNANYRVAEPFLRNSDLLTIDFNSIKNSETDSMVYDNPNGLYAEQACQISKYAGISDKMSCVGVFDVNPAQSRVANSLLAQLIWYFIEGVSERVGDFPIGSRKSYTKFFVHLEDVEDDLIFYKSDKSNRWWLEVKYQSEERSKYDRHCLVPCSQDDYEKALKNIIPDLWWKTLQKLN
ncbi:MAG: formimidoylglutamase [Flavicella sp.]|nr:formimidoylglutamase [Crocinitomicaceae bacterium]MDG2279848.1 formimidoylglutamase [Flavicella sp.]